MNYINLTGHEVHNLNSGLKLPAGRALRAKHKTIVEEIDGNLVHETKIAKVKLPEAVEGTIYIVSALLMSLVPSYRKDIWCPKQVIRDDNGNIIGCKDFRRKED